MIRHYRYLLIVCACLISSNVTGSANSFIRETERLIALSDATYTVVVNQYEQTYSYWTGIHRLIVRVIDVTTNELISEVLISSTQADRAMEEPYETTYSLMTEESQAMKNILVEPQTLYNNLSSPKYQFRIDSKGVYLEKNGRQDVLDYSVVQSRFSEAGTNLSHPIDARFDLDQYVNTSDYEFTGWYKSTAGGKQHFIFVLKIGRIDDDTGGFEYVFKIPDSED